LQNFLNAPRKLVVVVGIASPQELPIWGGADATKRWRIPSGWHHPGTHLICWWSHQSTVAVLLPTLGRKEADVQLFPLHFHNGDTVSVQLRLGMKL